MKTRIVFTILANNTICVNTNCNTKLQYKKLYTNWKNNLMGRSSSVEKLPQVSEIEKINVSYTNSGFQSNVQIKRPMNLTTFQVM